MKKILVVFAAILPVAIMNAQQISGTVKDEQGKVLASANVTLQKAADSSIVKINAANQSGKYEFNNIAPGKYFVAVSFTGHATAYSAAFDVNDSNVVVPEIKLEKTATSLAAVTIVSKKPMVEVKADKTILNVEGTINAVGSDGLELLRKSPGVLVDKDDNISLSGKNGVRIYVDGRQSPLAGKDLADYLRSLNSSSIEAIEIITNPSAKYDAAGNAGIINIRLKKNKTFGTNGSLTGGYGIGRFAKYNGGISLNHRNRGVNVFGNYNYNDSKNYMFMNLRRELLDTLFDQQNTIINKTSSHNFKTGADFFLNKKNTIGVIVSGNISDDQFATNSSTPITYIPSGITDRILVANNKNKAERNNVNTNINYRYSDTAGRELNVDADYGRYRLRSDQLQPNFYYDPASGNELNRLIYNMIAPTNIDIYTIKSDYEQNFKKGRLGIGFKTAWINSGNNFERYNVYSNGKTLDTLRSNHFDYDENINAAYVNYSRQMKGWMLQAGLRVENTGTKGRSTGFSKNGSGYTPYDSVFTRNYTNLFPSAAITFNKNPMSQWSLSYSRRIDRPQYQNLNPFEFKLDEYTFQKGNTGLRPQYTNSFGITHTYKYKLNTTLNYSHVSDVFTQLVDTAELSKSFITQKNLAEQDIVSINISYPLQVKWFSAFINFNGYYSHYQADFGGGNRTINLDVFAYNIFAQNSFDLGKGWKGELSGWYASPSIWGGTFESRAMWNVDMGMQKSLFDGKGNIKVSVSDVFLAMRWKGISNFAGQYLVASGGWESRQFKVNFTWRFGNNQVKAARQRSTASEEESKRVGSGSQGISQ